MCLWGNHSQRAPIRVKVSGTSIIYNVDNNKWARVCGLNTFSTKGSRVPNPLFHVSKCGEVCVCAESSKST